MEAEPPGRIVIARRKVRKYGDLDNQKRLHDGRRQIGNEFD